MYDPTNWFWLADDKRVFASARQLVVTDADPLFTAARARGLFTAWPRDDAGAQTIAALEQVLAPYGLHADLKACAAAKRYAWETAGVTVSGNLIKTDAASQAKIAAAKTAFDNATLTGTIQWKSATGAFFPANAAMVTAIYTAAVSHVQAGYTAEANAVAAINSGAATSVADVAAFFA